jgi:hypothetical protein
VSGHEAPGYGRWWPVGLVAGGAAGLWGLAGLLRAAAATRPGPWAAFLLAGLGVHDLLVVPAVMLAGRAVRRVGPRWRAPVRTALILSAVVVLVALPALFGDGRSTQPGNRSLLPTNYPLALAAVLALIWVAAAGWVSARAVGRRWRRPS